MKMIFSILVISCLTLSIEVNAQWASTGGPPSSRMNQSLATNGLNIFSGTNGGMVRSTTGGGNWLNIDNGLTYIDVKTVNYFSDYPDPSGSLFAGSERIYWSTNNGDQWNLFPNDNSPVPGNPTIFSILLNQNQIWVGTSKGVYYYDESIGWVPVNYGFPFGDLIKVFSLIHKDNNVFAGSDRGVFKLIDTTWVEKNNGLTLTTVYTLSSTGAYLFAGGGLFSGGVYVSSDNGDNWNLSFNVGAAMDILTIGSNIFVATYGDGVWHSTNYGNNWAQINDGLSVSAYKLFSIAKNDQDLFVGTESVGVWKRPLSQIVTEVANESITPTEFSLEQNYPNPFNPNTTIKYTIPNVTLSSSSRAESREENFVTLKIYDVLGNEVAILVNEKKPAGIYEVEFSATKLSSGIYFYKLQAGSFTQTKKMTVLK